jgi:hypothetical protein
VPVGATLWYTHNRLISPFSTLLLQLCDLGLAVKVAPRAATISIPCSRVTHWCWRDPHISSQMAQLAQNHPNPAFHTPLILHALGDLPVEVTPAADVYGFGVLMVELASCSQHLPGWEQRIDRLMQDPAGVLPGGVEEQLLVNEVRDIWAGLGCCACKRSRWLFWPCDMTGAESMCLLACSKPEAWLLCMWIAPAKLGQFLSMGLICA